MSPASLLESLLQLLFPDRCAGCRRFGELFCSDCQAQLSPYPAEHRAPPAVAGIPGAAGQLFPEPGFDRRQIAQPCVLQHGLSPAARLILPGVLAASLKVHRPSQGGQRGLPAKAP